MASRIMIADAKTTCQATRVLSDRDRVHYPESTSAGNTRFGWILATDISCIVGACIIYQLVHR